MNQNSMQHTNFKFLVCQKMFTMWYKTAKEALHLMKLLLQSLTSGII